MIFKVVSTLYLIYPACRGSRKAYHRFFDPEEKELIKVRAWKVIKGRDCILHTTEVDVCIYTMIKQARRKRQADAAKEQKMTGGAGGGISGNGCSKSKDD